MSWTHGSTAGPRTKVPAVLRGLGRNFLGTRWYSCGDEVEKDTTVSVKGLSGLGVSEQAVISSYSHFATSKRGKFFLFYK